MTSEQLPPLPEPFMELHREISPHVYAAWAEQMRAYAAAALAQEREACAKVCDAVAESANKAAVAGQYLIIRNGAEARRCSAAIRAQAADRLARHGIQIPEDEEYGNPSF